MESVFHNTKPPPETHTVTNAPLLQMFKQLQNSAHPTASLGPAQSGYWFCGFLTCSGESKFNRVSLLLVSSCCRVETLHPHSTSSSCLCQVSLPHPPRLVHLWTVGKSGAHRPRNGPVKVKVQLVAQHISSVQFRHVLQKSQHVTITHSELCLLKHCKIMLHLSCYVLDSYHQVKPETLICFKFAVHQCPADICIQISQVNHQIVLPECDKGDFRKMIFHDIYDLLRNCCLMMQIRRRHMCRSHVVHSKLVVAAFFQKISYFSYKLVVLLVAMKKVNCGEHTHGLNVYFKHL